MKKRPKLPEGRPCRLCGRPIGFLESSKSRTARIADQNLRRVKVAVDLRAVRALSSAGTEAWVFLPHWTTCPEAERFRESQILEAGQGTLPLRHEEEVGPPPRDEIDVYLLRMGRHGVPIEHDYRLAFDEVEVDREGGASDGRIVRIRTGKSLERSSP